MVERVRVRRRMMSDWGRWVRCMGALVERVEVTEEAEMDGLVLLLGQWAEMVSGSLTGRMACRGLQCETSLRRRTRSY